ncbi:MAG: hypothetical protein R3A47_07305 [Polyangiales bacterium]
MSTYFNATQGCRTGYTCTWGGIENDPSGICAPATNTAVTTPNVGATCASAADCYSPLGQGACTPEFGCVVFDCGVPAFRTISAARMRPA